MTLPRVTASFSLGQSVMSNLRKRWLDLGLGEVFGENAHSLGFIEAQVGKPRQNIVYVSGE